MLLKLPYFDDCIAIAILQGKLSNKQQLKFFRILQAAFQARKKNSPSTTN